MGTLYDLTNQYRNLLELAEEVDATTFHDTLEALQDSINDKAENISFVLQEIKGHIEILRNEEKRLKERRMTLEKRYDHLKYYLQNEMEGLGIDKVKSAHFNISLRTNPPKLSVLDEETIPDSYFITKRQLDKKTLKDAIKNGEEIEGVSLVQERGLSIK